MAVDCQRQFPGQVVGVLNAGVHPLRACRGVDVRGVARDRRVQRMQRVTAFQGQSLRVQRAIHGGVGGQPVRA